MSKRVVKQISMREHILKKSMWAGSKQIQTVETWLLDGDNFELEKVKYPPVLLKMIDEILVNALDHHTVYPTEVTEIEITIDESGTIAVMNNGPGITIELTKNLNAVPMYTPQLIFAEYLSGSNFEDDSDRTTGGTNGIGAKIVSVYSDRFTVETTDMTNGVFYRQTFTNGLLDIGQPQLIKLGSAEAKKLESYQRAGHTKIIFLPTYSEFKITAADIYEDLIRLVKSRAWFATAYTGMLIKFNDQKIKSRSFTEFCRKFTDSTLVSFGMTDGKNPWDICIGLSDGKERYFSLVNGICVLEGNHIKHIQTSIVEGLKSRIEKELKPLGVKFNRNLVTNSMLILARCTIPVPDFHSQTKEGLNDPIEKFAEYAIKTIHLDQLWELIKDTVLDSFMRKHVGETRTRVNRGKIIVPKYEEANFCRDAKHCLSCGLIVTEGDSAMGMARGALLGKISPDFNPDWFGLFSIQGVMVNGLKESVISGEKKKKELTEKAMTAKRTPNKKVLSNERLDSLMRVIGLDFKKNYGRDEQGNREWKTLRYGYIIGLMDQDLDGFNIFGLLSTFITTYWPNLVKRGFIRRINTPLIRAFPKSKKTRLVQVFYSEKNFKEWMEATGEETVKKTYKVIYYKGLATHADGRKEVKQIFTDIDNKIAIYTLDEDAIKQMHVHYGEFTNLRKETLIYPVTEEQTINKQVKLSKHFTIDTKLYQRDNILRKLLHMVDGLIPSRRKVLYVARKHARKELRVASLGGYVVSDANYHHGEASIAQTVMRMAQGFPYARNLPLLLPLGQCGSLSEGFKDYGAPRYVETMLNERLADKLFRSEDDYILDYEIEDGHRYEPKYYMPIIPYVLCETNEIPSTGWAMNIHARDIKAVFANIRDMITGRITECGTLPVWRKDFKGHTTKVGAREYSVGEYIYNEAENSINITELPHGMFSTSYLKGSKEAKKIAKAAKAKSSKDKVKKLKTAKKTTEEDNPGIIYKNAVDDFRDETSTAHGVNITLYLKPGAFEEISTSHGNANFDCIEDYFELKKPIYHRLNLVNQHGEVIQFTTYEAIFNSWYQFRKQLYKIRVEREIILINLEIQMLLNIQRFVENHDSYHITNKMTEEAIVKILVKNKYQIFNRSMIENPRYTTIEILKQQATNAEFGADHGYIMGLNYREISEEYYKRRADTIRKLQDRLVYLTTDDIFTGAKIWLKELDELEVAIKDGIASQWFYGTNDWEFEDELQPAVVKKKK